MKLRVLLSIAALAGGGLLLRSVPVAAQATGTVTGIVTNKLTGAPVAGAQMNILNSRIGAVSDRAGKYTIQNVPAGTHTVVAQFIGFAESRHPGVAVQAGQQAVLNIAMQETVLSLQEVVVTGVQDPTAGVKLPFTVAKVSAEALQVPTTNSALAAIQGKVAGASVVRGSGQPGSGVSILLRSPTAIETSNTPLIVVDGVIVARAEGNICATCEIESLDIASIEIIKGAAAASLYGSRAAAGVVSITTNRGRNTPVGESRVTTRTEFGFDQIGRQIPLNTHHQYRLTADGGAFADANGNIVTYQNRTTPTVAIADKVYPGKLYNNLDAVYSPNRFMTQSASVGHNSENSNFLITVNRFDQNGALTNNDGYWRNDGHVSIDQRFGDRFSVSLTGVHTRARQDVISGNPYTAATSYAPIVDLTRKDANGQYLQIPDSSVLIENPLWRQGSRDNYDDRTRTQGSLNTRLSLTRWLTLDAQYSYDRADNKAQTWIPKGTPTSVTADVPSDGELDLDSRITTAQNGQAAATATHKFGDLNARFTARGSFEREQSERFLLVGTNFLVPGVRDISAAGTLDGSSSSSTIDIRSNGYLGNLGFDFRDKYIVDALVRRDGSSLFGPLERWQTYYRGSAAWRLTQEPWFKLPHVDEFKLRYAIGTAGGRPSYGDIYENFSVSHTSVSRTGGTAGNTALKPQFTREQEFGIDIIGLDSRLQVELVYATQKSSGNNIAVPVPVITGYSSIRGNAGEVAGHTYEATVQGRLINHRDFTWQMAGVFDRSRNKITKWERSCFQGSNASGRDHELTCVGAQLGDFYLHTFVKDTKDLPWWLKSREAEFQVNDEGYMVWVGSGNTYRDGIAKSLWGTQFVSNSFTYRWGEPFIARDSTGKPLFPHRGASLADLNFGFTNSLRYKNLTLFTVLRGQLGGNVYNQVKQDLYGNNRHANVDQSGKPDELKKTVQYYNRALYDGNGYTDVYLEKGTYAKLSELSLRYRFTQPQLARFLGRAAPKDMSVGINGRNLFVLTGYSGFDPDTGEPLSREESQGYPQLRTFTMTFDITF